MSCRVQKERLCYTENRDRITPIIGECDYMLIQINERVQLDPSSGFDFKPNKTYGNKLIKGKTEILIKEQVANSTGKDKRPASERPIETLHRRSGEGWNYCKLSSDPIAEMMVKGSHEIIVSALKMIGVAICIETGPDTILMLYQVVGERIDITHEYKETVRIMLKAAESLIINGERLKLSVADIDETARKLYPVFGAPTTEHIDIAPVIEARNDLKIGIQPVEDKSKSTSHESSGKKKDGNNNTIEQYVPAGVVLTDTQKNHLQAVVTLAANQDQVKMIDVAHYLDKSTSAVNSAMKMLSQKGVLETDHSGVITLTKNESQQTKKPKKETQKGSEKAEKEARKTDAKPKKELKAASGKNSPVKEKEYVTADVLDQSSDGEKFTGIHNVEEGCEWISCNGFWAMKVPAGYSYTMDVTLTGTNPNGGKSELEIQQTGNTNFSKSLNLPFSLAVYPEVLALDLTDDVADLSSHGMKESIDQTLQVFQGKALFENAVQSPDLIVKYAVQKLKDRTQVTFLIIVSGSGMVSLGEAVLDCTKSSKLWIDLMEMLVTVKKIPQNLSFYRYSSDYLPMGGKLQFRGTELTTSNGEKVAVPEGYKWSTDSSIISSRTFSIVPESAPFWDGIADQSRTCIDLSGMMLGFEGIKDAKGRYTKVAQYIVKQLPDNVMETNQAIHLVKLADDGVIFIQQNADQDDMKDCLIRALKVTDHDAKLYSIRIYFPEKIPRNLVNKVVIDCRRFAACWLHTFLSPIDSCDYGYANFQPVVPLSESQYEHYTLVESGSYTTRRDADFVGQSIRSLMQKTGNTDHEIYHLMAEDPDQYDLDEKALKIAQIFRMKERKFDPYHDTEAFINRGMIEKVEALHKLRTFAWVWGAMAEEAGRKVTDASKFHAFDYYYYTNHQGKKDRITLNYNGIRYFTALCNQDDWHVFYVPDIYLLGSMKHQYDLRQLCGKENRGGNTISFALTGIGIDNLDDMRRNDEIISRNEETLASLDALRKDLSNLLPVMEALHDTFLERRIRSQPLTGFLPDVLAAWCALCVAAKEPFYSEEAADTPEANAALEGPMTRPDTPLNTRYIGKKGEPPNPLREVRLDLHGASVVKEFQFRCFLDGEILILPEGLKEIQLQGFANGRFLEVRFPRSMRIIGANAFMDCERLEEVVIPEGTEVIDFGAFSRKNDLTDIYLPDSLKKLDTAAFYESNDNRKFVSHINVHLSGKCAAQLKIVQGLGPSQSPPYSVAKAFIIDGKAYSKIEDYQAELERADRERREKQRQEEEEARKEAQRESLRKEIARLENEKAELKGLFSGMKKKKLQNQIEELLDDLRKI